MGATLSLISPTQGRPTLERMIASGRDQLLPGDEWLVVIDAHEMAREAVRAVARRVGAACAQCRPLSLDVGHHDHGHSQINDGMEEARGDWLVHMDDDDIFTPGALDAIRRAIAALDGPRPLLFRFEAHFGRRPLVWRRAGQLAPGTVGGHGLVHPNIAGAIGRFTSRYEGDYDCIRETIDLWGGRVEWVDAVIARCRPKDREVVA